MRNLSKTPSGGTCLEEPSEGFCDVGCCSSPSSRNAPYSYWNFFKQLFMAININQIKIHETYHFFYINLSIFYAQARLGSSGGSAEQMYTALPSLLSSGDGPDSGPTARLLRLHLYACFTCLCRVVFDG